MKKTIKMNLDFFDDPRVALIEAMPNKDTILYIWIRLLFLQCKNLTSNDDGTYLIPCQTTTYTEAQLSSITHIRQDIIHQTLNTLYDLAVFPHSL